MYFKYHWALYYCKRKPGSFYLIFDDIQIVQTILHVKLKESENQNVLSNSEALSAQHLNFIFHNPITYNKIKAPFSAGKRTNHADSTEKGALTKIKDGMNPNKVNDLLSKHFYLLINM
ncbi:Hypothetical_protein [Hexamita inflata]|uniref:Hypothetical_protein n=1 Tax=Hexamita inflata TaxID=28002 RepID=A0AA86RP43_9EUKA|nr:Hypothetical protein HINF_LOCUS63067 [Hexamita inflata]